MERIQRKKLLDVGIPMGLQFSITAIGTMIVQAALNGLGPVYIAGFSAAGKIGNIATQAFPSLGVAMATYTGQNMGAGRYDRVKKGVSAGFIVCMVCSVITGAAVYLFGPYMMRIFASGDSGQMMEYGVEYLKISAWFYPPLSLIFCTGIRSRDWETAWYQCLAAYSNWPPDLRNSGPCRAVWLQGNLFF